MGYLRQLFGRPSPVGDVTPTSTTMFFDPWCGTTIGVAEGTEDRDVAYILALREWARLSRHQ